MNTEYTDDELDLAVEEFMKTFNTFKKAAEKLMAIMDSMNKKRRQELEGLSGGNRQIHEFLVQIMDDSGQIGEKRFGIKCLAENEKRQK